MAKMIRRNFLLTPSQDKFLKTFRNLTASENIRRAIDEYIVKNSLETAATSPTKSK